MLERMGQAGVLPAVGVMTLQTAVLSRENSLVTGLQRCGAQIMTVDAKPTAFRLEQIGSICNMGGMAGITLTFFGRSVCDAILPVTINFVTAQAKTGLFLEQIGCLVIAVSRVAGIAVQPGNRLVGMLGGRHLLQLIVAGQANRIAIGW
jgi:hypothetical protein